MKGKNNLQETRQPVLSVIIPVYNVADYIEKCAHSLFSQTFADIEFIFVDDRSPDDSIAILNRILKDYPNRAARTKIISNSINLGVGASRQTGVSNATGRYIIHCDPDDWVDPDYYEKLVAKAESDGCDMVISDFVLESPDRVLNMCQNPGQLEYDHFCDLMCGLGHPRMHGSLCNKLIRRSCYDGYIFPPGLDYCEDVLFLLNLRGSNIRMGYMAGSAYHYRVTPSSITNSYRFENIGRENRFIEAVESLSDKGKITPAQRDSIIAGVLYGHILHVKDMPGEYFKSRYSKYRKTVSSNRQLGVVARSILFIALSISFRTAQRVHAAAYKTVKLLKHPINSLFFKSQK